MRVKTSNRPARTPDGRGPAPEGGRSGSSPQPNRLRLICLILALLTLLIYLPVYFHDFVLLDDPLYISANPIVRVGLTWAGVKWAFTTWSTARYWLPLTWLSHMLDCQLFGLNPGPPHLVNVLFHAANAVLLLVIWYRLTRAYWVAAFIAALFAWHPLRVESVAWAAERKDVLSMFLGLLALWFYIGFAQRRSKAQLGARQHYCLSLIFFAASLMAKPMWVTFPFVLLLLDYWPLQRWLHVPPNSKIPTYGSQPLRLVIEKWPFFVLAGLLSVITFLAARSAGAIVPLNVVPPALRLSNALVSYVEYLSKIFWPANLAAFYPLRMSIPVWQPVAAVAVLLAVSLVTWRLRQSRPYLFLGWFWFVGTFVPMIGLAQAGIQGMADRFTYLPSIGIAVLCTFAARDLMARFRLQALVGGVIAGVVLVSCILVTEHQLSFWRNTETLMVRTIAVTRNNFMARTTLGMYYNHEGHTRKALSEFREALRIQEQAVVRIPALLKQSASVHLQLGAAFEREGNNDEALKQYQAALNIEPSNPKVHTSLGALLAKMNKPDEAEAQYREAIRLAPDDLVAYYDLGQLFVNTGRLDDGLREYEQAARLRPEDPRAQYFMGRALLRSGSRAEAIKHFQMALRCDPEDVESLTYLARVLASDSHGANGDGAEAVALAEKANALTRSNEPFVLDTLAMAYADVGRFTNAQQTIRQAIEKGRGSGQNEDATQMQQRLELYEAGQPYRE
jgi:protein O-mannosyl-transferase